MTQTKAYNLKLYCDLKNIHTNSEEAQGFIEKTFYEQLTIIKDLKTNNTKGEEEESVEYSIIDRIIKK